MKIINPEKNKEDSTNYLSEKDLISIKQLIETYLFWQRIGSTIKTWAITIVALISAWNVGGDFLKNLIKTIKG